MFIRAVLGWRRVQQEGQRLERAEYLDMHSLSKFSLRFINGSLKYTHTHTHLDTVSEHFKSLLFTGFAAGLISQFSTNLHEAKLVSRSHECQRHTSLYNKHSNEDELLKAVLLAGFYPNLIQVHGNKEGCYNTAFVQTISSCAPSKITQNCEICCCF